MSSSGGKDDEQPSLSLTRHVCIVRTDGAEKKEIPTVSRVIFTVAALLLAVSTASASSICLFTNFQHLGAEPVDYTVCLLLEDDPNDTFFTVSAEVAATSPNIADIVAVYLSVDNDPLPDFIAADFTSVSGGPITGFASDTSNVQAGNIGQVFDIGLAIGSTGLAGGTDDFQSTVFTMARKGLTLDDFTMFGIRGSSVGPADMPGGEREESAKEISSITFIPAGDPIPAPAAAGMGLVALAGLMRRR